MLLWCLCLMHPPLYENFNDKCKMAHDLHIHLPFALKHFGLRFGPFVKNLDQMFVHRFSPINMIPIVCFHHRNCIYIVNIVNFLPMVYHLHKCRGSNVTWRLKLSNIPLLCISMPLMMGVMGTKTYKNKNETKNTTRKINYKKCKPKFNPRLET